MTEMTDKVLAYIKKWEMLKEHDKVIVGISGGADSVCLLFVLLEMQKAIHFTLVAVHVHHGLRGDEADYDEAYVKKLCETKGVKLLTYHYDVESIAKNQKQSTEEAGRILRREIFAKVKREQQGTKIAVAHHKNDNVETLLLNLARGTGLKGLGGMLPVRDDMIRPLLCVERTEIEHYLEIRGITFCTDSTNHSNDYTRNKIRNCVLPYLKSEINDQVIEHMNETMEQMREIQCYVKEQLKDYEAVCVKSLDQQIVILKKEFNQVPHAFKNPLIQACLEKITKQEQDISKHHIELVRTLFDKQVGRELHLPYQVIASRIYEGIQLEQKEVLEKIAETGYITLMIPGTVKSGQMISMGFMPGEISCRIFPNVERNRIPQKNYTKWFDYDIIKGDLVIRTRQTGDYLIIDSQGNRQKLKSYFINNKIPGKLRDHILLVAEGSHVLWIVGYRMSHAYQVQEHTKRILEIEIDGGSKDGRDN